MTRRWLFRALVSRVTTETTHRFLIVRLGALGDVVHSIPIVPALRASFPGARIDWLVKEKLVPLVELVEGVDAAIPYPESFGGKLACIRHLRGAGYTCAIDLQGRYLSAFLAAFSGAPKRVGRAAQAAREPGAALLYTDRIVPMGKHVVEMNMSLAVGAGAGLPAALQFPLRVPGDALSRRLRDKLLLEGLRDYIVLSPGGGWASKCWPPKRFGALATELWNRARLRVLVNIGPGEEELARAVAAATAIDAAPGVVSPSLKELVVLLAEARLVVAGDTGTLHLAAALGTRVVGLFGDTDPARNGPLPHGAVVHNDSTTPTSYVRGNYVRGSVPSAAMLSITVDQVLAAAEQELAITA